MKLNGNTISFRWTVDGETITVTLRRPTPTELDRFTRDRFRVVTYGSRKNQVESHQTEARLALVDAILTDVKGLEITGPTGRDIVLGKGCSLTQDELDAFSADYGYPVRSWRDLVPAEWRVQWAQRFEEGAGEEEEGPAPAPLPN